jgi:shikimate dehydrogenase
VTDVSEKKFGILAYPAEHSLSPVMFRAAGLDYEVFEVGPDEFEAFVRDRDFDGLSVSLPYKERILPFLDEASDDVEKIGACNTVLKNEDGKLSGFNTDWIGAVEALEEVGVEISGKKVIILGAGGAARAICYGLLQEGADVVVLNRDLDEARGIADDFGVEIGLLDPIEGRDCDVLIQATSVWLTAGLDVKIVPDSFVQKLGERGGVVMDIVYKPLITPLLKIADEAGCKIVTGEKMLLNQALKQYEIWTGQDAPAEVMKNALENSLK